MIIATVNLLILNIFIINVIIKGISLKSFVKARERKFFVKERIKVLQRSIFFTCFQLIIIDHIEKIYNFDYFFEVSSSVLLSSFFFLLISFSFLNRKNVARYELLNHEIHEFGIFCRLLYEEK